MRSKSKAQRWNVGPPAWQTSTALSTLPTPSRWSAPALTVLLDGRSTAELCFRSPAVGPGRSGSRSWAPPTASSSPSPAPTSSAPRGVIGDHEVTNRSAHGAHFGLIDLHLFAGHGRTLVPRISAACHVILILLWLHVFNGDLFCGVVATPLVCAEEGEIDETPPSTPPWYRRGSDRFRQLFVRHFGRGVLRRGVSSHAMGPARCWRQPSACRDRNKRTTAGYCSSLCLRDSRVRRAPGLHQYRAPAGGYGRLLPDQRRPIRPRVRAVVAAVLRSCR